MCRRNEPLGIALLSCGVGLLVSLLFGGDFVRVILALIFFLLGWLVLRR